MPALIDYVCTADHVRRDTPAITIEQGRWAYCPFGGDEEHEWHPIEPTAVEVIRMQTRTQPTLFKELA